MKTNSPPIEPLPHADALIMQAAEGWLALGDHHSANEELNAVTLKAQIHPDVIAARWEIFRRAKHWDICEGLSRALTDVAPHQVRSWILHAHTLSFTEKTQQAHDLLQAKSGEFSQEWSLWHHLGWYAHRLGRSGEAKEHLLKAVQLGPQQPLSLPALDDPAYEPPWKRQPQG